MNDGMSEEQRIMAGATFDREGFPERRSRPLGVNLQEADDGKVNHALSEVVIDGLNGAAVSPDRTRADSPLLRVVLPKAE